MNAPSALAIITVINHVNLPALKARRLQDACFDLSPARSGLFHFPTVARVKI